MKFESCILLMFLYSLQCIKEALLYKGVYYKRAAVAAVFVFLMTGCQGKAGGEALEDKYGSDALYYLALLARREGKEGEAMSLFAECAEKSTSIASERSKAEAIKPSLGTVNEEDKAKEEGEGEGAKEDKEVQERELSAVLHECIEEKQYDKAYSLIDDAKEYIIKCIENGENTSIYKWEIVKSVVSDIGKAALYSGGSRAKRADVMNSIFSIIDNVHCESNIDKGSAVYNALFYSARLYNAAGITDSAREKFREAMNRAATWEESDNAMWYLLNMELNKGIDLAIDVIKTKKWHDASYFDDIMEELSQKILAATRWKDYAKVFALLLSDKAIRPSAYSACECVAQYAYIYARLIEEGLLIEGDKSYGEGILPSAEGAMRAALDGGADRYYRALAISKLNLTGEDEERAMLHTASRKTEKSGAEGFLTGFIDFNLVDMVYDEWQKEVSNKGKYIGEECALSIASALFQAGYVEQSLRVASRTANLNDTPYITREMLMCLFPQGMKESVERVCKQMQNARYGGLNEEYAFALIRSESFFNANAVSSAGAIGLTQLLPSTASDIARVLKKEDEDPLKADVNIEFGLKYLFDLIDRVDGVPLLAFLSYNTGISRVRRYVKANNANHIVNSKGEKSIKPLPLDLFMEVLPYKETRGYGRKLVSAAAVYGYLYYGKSVKSVVQSIFTQGVAEKA